MLDKVHALPLSRCLTRIVRLTITIHHQQVLVVWIWTHWSSKEWIPCRPYRQQKLLLGCVLVM